MATVFLSYDHDDAERAAPIAAAFEKAGHSVWWDRHIHGGAQYNDEIEAAVEEADAVVVLWSERSVRSTWVRDEAAEGRDQNKLVPVLIDAVKPPMGFRQFQAIDCTRSNRTPSGSSLQQILDSIDKIGGAPQARSPAPAHAAKPSRRYVGRLSRRAGMAIAVVALVAAAAVMVWNWRTHNALPVVAIAAADSTPSSQALAQDLFVKLGTLEHVGSSKWQLSESQSAPSDPDLVFRVAESRSATQLQASLVLMDGKRDGLLWSRQFVQPVGAEPDLRLQVSQAAGIALACALEGRKGDELTADLLKRYLASCTETAVGSDMEIDKTVAAMRSIIAERPRFKPAWASLLSAQSGVLGLAEIEGGTTYVAARRRLVEDIENARKVAPGLPEIAVAEIELLSPFDYGGALERIAQAKAKASDDAGTWSMESFYLISVGRMVEAIASARRAAELEPLSAGATSQMILALAYGGQIEAAKKELALAERRWAGTETLRDTQWGFHLRYGDPRIAKSVRGQAGDLYLQARLEPTPANIQKMEAEIERVSAMDFDQLGYAIQALAEFDKTDKVYRWLDRTEPSRLARFSYLLFRPAFDDVRRDRRFMKVAKRIGLLSYWRKSGKWADFCYDPNLPYDCRKEAARLGA